MAEKASFPLSRRSVLAGLGASVVIGPVGAQTSSAELELRAAPLDRFIEGSGTPIKGMAYNGQIPGPLIRVKRGKKVSVRLPGGPLAPRLHWHGVRLAEDSEEGGAGDFIAPDAGTYWYHPDLTSSIAEVQAGLCGMLIVEEEQKGLADRDVPLILGTMALMLDGAPKGVPTVATVNGQPSATLSIGTHERLRLRLLNASMIGPADLAIAGLDTLIVASDGQPLDRPFAPVGQRLIIPPGGRIDLIVDGTLKAGQQAGIAIQEWTGVRELIRFELNIDAPARSQKLPPPEPFPSNGLPKAFDLMRASTQAALDVSMPKKFDPAKPLFEVKRGTLVTLAFTNRYAFEHTAHVHGHSMRLLHPNDDGWEPYWVDTVPVRSTETIRVTFLADNPGNWLIESHACIPTSPPTWASVTTWFRVAG